MLLSLSALVTVSNNAPASEMNKIVWNCINSARASPESASVAIIDAKAHDRRDCASMSSVLLQV